MTLFDTHSHIQDAAFAGDRDAVIARARAAGVGAIAVCGWDAASNTAAIALAALHEGLLPAVGFHPHDASGVTPAMLAELEAQAASPVVAAVGEIGLDYYRDLSPREVQRRVLDDQLAIAVGAAKPVCVHTRSAEEDIYPQLEAFAQRSPLVASGRPAGVMHCFGGTLEQAQRFVALGFLVSLACTVTYPNNMRARAIAAALPLSALVVETDSPYLPPEGQRGKRNEPASVRAAVAAVAAVRGLPFAAVAEATTANASRLFGVAVAQAVVA